MKARRRTYWFAFFCSLAMLIVAAILSFVLLGRQDVPIFLAEHGIYRTYIFFGIRISSLVLSIGNVLISCLLSVVLSATVLRIFQKTVSPEVYFFVFWLASCAFEAIRLLSLVAGITGASDVIISFYAKVYVAAKVFGLLALFISGLHAAGLRNEKHFSMILTALGVSGALAAIMPVNTGIWDATLMYRIGYERLFVEVVGFVFLVTVLCYLGAVSVRGDKAYYFATGGILSVMVGTSLLSMDVSPLATLFAVVLTMVGGILYITKLHAYYLWQ
ncbi:MAG TPA: hypothetical protein PK759_01735 [Spirochaetales bacterium]|nr:hypothetical protein [Spirochaetales bacterium]HPS14501.1 hypothetical protein [Spirochaetales bacterium]